MERLELSIDDTKWPKLKMTITRTDVNGVKTSVVKEFQYDLAYIQFEGEVHNKLRPMVDNLIQRRLRR